MSAVFVTILHNHDVMAELNFIMLFYIKNQTLAILDLTELFLIDKGFLPIWRLQGGNI